MSATARNAALAALKSGSYTNITPVQSVEDLTNAAVKYMQTTEGIQSVRLYDSTTDEMIRFNKGRKQWEASKMFSTGEINVRTLDASGTVSRVQEAIRLSSLQDPSSEIFDFGFTQIQQSRAEQMLKNFKEAKHIGTTVSATTSYDQDTATIRAMGATRDELRYGAYYGPMPQGLERNSAHPMEAFNSVQKASYVKRLAEAKMSNSMLDAATRRRAVEIAHITSGIPYQQGQDLSGQAKEFIRKRLEKKLNAGEMTQAQYDAFLDMSTKDLVAHPEYGQEISMYNTRASKVSKATSEFGIGHMEAQNVYNIRTATGGTSVPQIPMEVLRDVDIEIAPGKKVKYLSKEYLADRERNRFALSSARYSKEVEPGVIQDLVRTNLIAGDVSNIGNVLSEEVANAISERTTSHLQEIFNRYDDLKEAVNAGYFSSEESAQAIKQELESDAVEFTKKNAQALRERGHVVASAGERSSWSRFS